MTVKIFVDMLSPTCRALYIFSKKNNLPVSFEILSVFKGDQRKEEFVKINPLKMVPALKDGDFVMGESCSILRYLAEKFDTADHWFPKDLQKRAKVNEVLDWHHSDFKTNVDHVYWLRVMAPVFKVEVPQEKLSRAIEDLNSSLDTIENVFIKDRNFLAGDQISAADLIVIEYIDEFRYYGPGLDLFEGRPKLSAWRERVKQAVGKQLHDETHRTLQEQDLKTVDTSTMGPYKAIMMRLIS